jgi:hypothetical protein
VVDVAEQRRLGGDEAAGREKALIPLGFEPGDRNGERLGLSAGVPSAAAAAAMYSIGLAELFHQSG